MSKHWSTDVFGNSHVHEVWKKPCLPVNALSDIVAYVSVYMHKYSFVSINKALLILNKDMNIKI